MWFSCFPILPGSAEVQVIWGGIVKRLLIAYFIGNISAKNIFNPFMCVKVIASQRWDFFWDTVYYRFTVLFRDHPSERVPEENFWTLWCEGRLTEADTPTIWPCATLSRLTSAHLHHPPLFLQAGCPFCGPTNSVKVLKAASTFGSGRRC